MARRSTLRASDADRERAAERLRHAAGEGRLLTEELEDRLGGVFSARTYGQLHALVADLPVPRARSGHRLPVWARAGLAVALVLGVLAAVAIAAALLAAILCLWLIWMVLSWRVLGRRPRFRYVGHARVLATSLRQAQGTPAGPRACTRHRG